MADNNVLFAALGLWSRHSPEEYLIVLSSMVIVSLVWMAAGAQKRFRRSESGNAETAENENAAESPGSIAAALGGVDNIYDVGCSDTRLRVRVNRGELVDRRRLKETGAVGVLAKKREVQVFYDERARLICGGLREYIDRMRSRENEEKSEENSFERVLKKVYAPVEGDIVHLSDICHVQDMGDGYVGGFAVRAARGEVRAPFDCKAGYSETGEKASEIICSSSDGWEVRVRLMVSGQHEPVQIIKCANGESVRKGRLLLEYNYDELAAGGEAVYAVAMVRRVKAEDGRPGQTEGMFLKVCAKENVNYEHVACMVAE